MQWMTEGKELLLIQVIVGNFQLYQRDLRHLTVPRLLGRWDDLCPATIWKYILLQKRRGVLNCGGFQSQDAFLSTSNSVIFFLSS